MAKQKFYVVWHGVTPGIYDSWDACKLQVSGFDGARYKSFSSREEAEIAYADSADNYVKSPQTKKKAPNYNRDGIVQESIAVDAACSGNPGKMEYRGVYVKDNIEMFRSCVYEQGTNNIGEFLAIVHALALLGKNEKNIPIYSDSVNAIKWVKNKKCNTKLKKTSNNAPLFSVIERAEQWLTTNSYSTRIIKWETDKWGEIPADFGRK